MKRFILFLFITFTVSGCKLLESIISEHGISMCNLSNNEVVVWGTYDQTMGTRLPDEKPVTELVVPSKNLSVSPYDFIMRQGYDWTKSLSATDTIRVFVFDSEKYKETDWSTIRDQYLILLRYDFTKAELDALGWLIAYPPTPEMKDIKMWPPYEEVIKNAQD
ncbi:MAG: membrane lipoprotein lipid attachment site-containing protein [Bacteroidales bacterium]|nr:membrane lipoprotein lipid attachment site-containing protein [Bacteroidales bacterium]